MEFREFAPCRPLGPFIQLIYALKLNGPAGEGSPLRIVPDGVVELVFHAAAPFAMCFGAGASTLQPRSFALSQTRRFVEIVPTGPGDFVAVRFRPWATHHFCPVPVHAFADDLVAVSDLWGPEVVELEDRLARADRLPHRVALVEQFLLRQLTRHHNPGGDELARTVWQHMGRMSVARLSRELGVGQRRLERVVRSTTGMTPRHLGRLSRFLRACATVRRRVHPTLTDVGLACGYYDQSHFIGEFREFSGMTPGEFDTAPHVVFNDA